MPLTKEQKKEQKNNLMHVKLAKGDSPTVVTAKSTKRAVIGEPPTDEFDAQELEDEEEEEIIDPKNPPSCDGCLKQLPEGRKDKGVKVYYAFDKYTIFVCHKCWKDMKIRDRIELSRLMYDDTKYNR